MGVVCVCVFIKELGQMIKRLTGLNLQDKPAGWEPSEKYVWSTNKQQNIEIDSDTKNQLILRGENRLKKKKGSKHPYGIISYLENLHFYFYGLELTGWGLTTLLKVIST